MARFCLHQAVFIIDFLLTSNTFPCCKSPVKEYYYRKKYETMPGPKAVRKAISCLSGTFKFTLSLSVFMLYHLCGTSWTSRPGVFKESERAECLHLSHKTVHHLTPTSISSCSLCSSSLCLHRLLALPCLPPCSPLFLEQHPTQHAPSVGLLSEKAKQILPHLRMLTLLVTDGDIRVICW